jgi:hypothetical protein
MNGSWECGDSVVRFVRMEVVSSVAKALAIVCRVTPRKFRGSDAELLV